VISFRRGERGYPPLLQELYDPPERLFVRGGPVESLAGPAVAVVGARSCSAYGTQVARNLARELAAAGVVVVSGLARGIDGEAHRGALEGGGPTVAVLGCGIDRDYPRRHAELARRICERGAVVSEYPPGIEPAPWRFPARNRIIAGLALATVVVEARERSGALITADFALELGRDVFAVPGEITAALSAGTNDLLRQGAAPLLSAGDVLDAIGVERTVAARAPVSEAAERLLPLLTDTSRDADELVRLSGQKSGHVAAALVELELAGLVAEAEGVYRAQELVSGCGSSPGRAGWMRGKDAGSVRIE
jgi:DNA processing protein